MTHDIPKLSSAFVRILKTNWKERRYGHPLKSYRVDGKIYWNLHMPGFPSPAFDRGFRHYLAHNLGMKQPSGLYSAYVAITKKCDLNCEHCLEGETINQPETQSEQDILGTVERLMSLGAVQIIFTGGEPVNRFSLLQRILTEFHDREVQFWINTSGTGLTADRIQKLKQNGLTGIIFSLDHHDEQKHDRFRGREGCYRQVISSIMSANESGLVTAAALCATNEFISLENLDAYIKLSANLNLTFLRILEPKPLGKYEGHNVSLEPEKRHLLESFYDRAAGPENTLGKIPVISYPEIHIRRHGCDCGKLLLYIDADGRAFPCPFYRKTSASIAELTPSNLETKLTCSNTIPDK